MEIDVICPSCGEKALFKPNGVEDNTGVLKCVACGLIKNFSITHENYYYKVQVGKRYLIAKNKNFFIGLRDFFASNEKFTVDPNEDFPAIFYSRRNEIVEKIDKFFQKE